MAGRRTKYPWVEWFASDKFTVKRGVDFTGRTDSFIQMVRQRAIGRDLRIRMKVSEDGDTVTVLVEKFVPDAEDAKPVEIVPVAGVSPVAAFDLFSS